MFMPYTETLLTKKRRIRDHVLYMANPLSSSTRFIGVLVTSGVFFMLHSTL
jgi:hypothetical protein